MVGHAERLHSTESDDDPALPRALSEDEVKKLLEECDEGFIKLHVTRLVRSQVKNSVNF